MTAADAPDRAVIRGRARRATMAVYGMLSLAGVIAAASYKDYIQDAAELAVLVVGTSLSIGLAHAWAEFAAHRLVGGARLTRDQVVDEASYIAAFLVPGVVICLLAFALSAGDADIASITTNCLSLLIGGLFTVGVLGARRAGSTWARSLAWGLVDAGFGIVILVLKLVLS